MTTNTASSLKTKFAFCSANRRTPSTFQANTSDNIIASTLHYRRVSAR